MRRKSTLNTLQLHIFGKQFYAYPYQFVCWNITEFSYSPDQYMFQEENKISPKKLRTILLPNVHL